MHAGGGAVTDLEAEQTALTEVLVTWTAPSPVPPRGYLVTVASANIIDTASGTSHTLTISQPGLHTIQVQPLSRHYPSEAMSVEVTVRGKADQRPAVITNGTSTSFTGLNVYMVIVNATFDTFDAQRTVDMNFTSLSHGRCNEIHGSSIFQMSATVMNFERLLFSWLHTELFLHIAWNCFRCSFQAS